MNVSQGTTSKSSNTATTTTASSNVDNTIKNSASTTTTTTSTIKPQPKLSKSTSSTTSKEIKSDDTINKPDPIDNAGNTQTTIMRRASRKKSPTTSTSSSSIDSVQIQQPIKEENSTSKVAGAASDSITKKPSTMDESTMNGKITKKVAGDAKSIKQTTTATAIQSPLRPTSSSTDFSRASFNSFSGSGSITSSNDDGYHEEMFEQSSTHNSNKKRLTAFGAPLPWGQYAVMDDDDMRKKEEWSLLSSGTMEAVDQLVATHAHITSAKFPTMSITDAENMRQVIKVVMTLPCIVD